MVEGEGQQVQETTAKPAEASPAQGASTEIKGSSSLSDPAEYHKQRQIRKLKLGSLVFGSVGDVLGGARKVATGTVKGVFTGNWERAGEGVRQIGGPLERILHTGRAVATRATDAPRTFARGFSSGGRK